MDRFGGSTQPTRGAYLPICSKSPNDTPGQSGTGRAYSRRALTYPAVLGRRLPLPDPQAPSTGKGWTLSGRLQNSSTQRQERSRKHSLPGCHRRPQRSSMRYRTRFGEIGASLILLTLGRNGQGVQCVHDQIVVSIPLRAEENTSELQSLMRTSYAVV